MSLLDTITGGFEAGYNNQTQRFNQNTFGSQSQSGTATTNRNLTPFQENLQSPLFAYITRLLTDPKASIAPFQNQAREDVNANYGGLADRLRKQFMSTGGGESGKFGDALIGGEVARTGDLSRVDNTYSQAAAQLPMTASALASQLLGMNFGQTTNQAESGTSSSNTSGTNKSSGFSLKI